MLYEKELRTNRITNSILYESCSIFIVYNLKKDDKMHELENDSSNVSCHKQLLLFKFSESKFICIALVTIEDIFSATLSFILMHNNRRRFKKALLEGNYRHALSQRYQVAENIKITRFFFL